jgi:gamma-glutamyltranspeptidase
MPDKLTIEPALAEQHADLVKQLEAMGHVVERWTTGQGDAHSIQIDPQTGRRLGIADKRRDGWASGY